MTSVIHNAIERQHEDAALSAPQKYQSKTKPVGFRLPVSILAGLDRDAKALNMTRSEVITKILIERYGDKPVKRSVFD